MTYCGYVKLLIVLVLILLRFLLAVVILLFIFFMLNFHSFFINVKFFENGFFGDFELLFNIWNLLFLIIVVMIRLRVIVFSFSYIRGLIVGNFIALYIIFIFSILWLIMHSNFYWIIFGWDGLGVVSFLLIVYYMNHERVNNGLFTIFQNRVGDLFFVLFIVGLVNLSMFSSLVLKSGLIFLVIGGSVKRAQFPFNAWLLSAIRAPTPISSLVHSSTLVVAGVYILLQYSYCLVDVLYILKDISVLSLILSSIGLLVERDIKKLIAYSTIRHVSLIIYLLRFGLYKVVYFHLNIHAIFKSLMFICFGFVILSSFHAQDKRLVSLLNINPVIKIVYYFSCLCLGGLPILRVFFSKDLILEKFIEFSIEFIYILMLIGFLAVRIYYSIKLIMLVNVIFSFVLVEKRFFGILSVVVISVAIIRMINIFLSLVFRLRLEFFSFKITIYILIAIFFFLRIYFKIIFKFSVYNKIRNFKEIWFLNVYLLDQYMYWNIIVIIRRVMATTYMKFVVLINWWVIVLFIVIFYNRSLKV